MKTKFGIATLDAHGYYQITSRKEDNNGKYLHRLIFEDFYNTKLPSNVVIHHEDGNPLNNEIWNLVPMTREEHSRLHMKGNQFWKGKHHSEETKLKIGKNSTGFLGKKHSLDSKIKNSISSNNNSGYFRVHKHKKTTAKQGFQWVYRWYDENGKRRYLYNVDIKKLEERVKAEGLEWFKLPKEDLT